MRDAWELIDSELIWAGSMLTWCLSLAVIVVAAAMGWIAWRRSGGAWGVGGLEVLRTAIIASVAILLNQPEWVQSFRSSQQPTVMVLHDQSASMRTRDVPAVEDGLAAEGGPVTADGSAAGDDSAAPDSSGEERWRSRLSAVDPWLDPATWGKFEDKFSVVFEPIAAAAAKTDLGSPLLAVAEGVEPLLGVIMISDGDWTEGPPPVKAAARLRSRGVPLFAVPVGSPTRLPDLELVAFEVPTFAPLGKPVRVPLTIESWLPREVTTTVTMTIVEGAGEVAVNATRTAVGERVTQDVVVEAMGRTEESLVWEPQRTGEYTLIVELPLQPEEAVRDNNRVTAQITIREEQLRVLVVESSPRWEYRYLRNALSRDPGVELSCLLFHPGLDQLGGGASDYIREFPESIEALSPFDVVILGDVGLGSEQLTEKDCELLRGLVERQASGLVLIPGWQGRQLSLLQSELSDLFPVRLDESQPGGVGSATPGQMRLTESGRRSLLTRLDDIPEENRRVWDELPGFQWYAPVLRAKPGAEVLAVHRDIDNQYGSLPLLVTHSYGAGKVLFMGTDGAWRWREGVEDQYHYRFWGQVVRWMAYQRNMARGETMRLYHLPDQPELGQSVSLYAHVMQPSGEPLQRGDVVARVMAPSGASQTVRLVDEGDEWGVYHGRYEPQETGRHELRVLCQQTDSSLEASLFVGGDPSEQPGRPARPDVLDELAMVTGGETIAVDQLSRVMQRLAALPEPPATVRRVAIWSHPITGGVIVLMMAAFWVWRKAAGLV